VWRVIPALTEISSPSDGALAKSPPVARLRSISSAKATLLAEDTFRRGRTKGESTDEVSSTESPLLRPEFSLAQMGPMGKVGEA
jgi:hypothetical protein